MSEGGIGLRRFIPWFLRRGGPCSHSREVNPVPPPTDVCLECVALDDSWFHLRQCLICGQTSCCDQSKNKHAAAHFQATRHPIIRSAQPGEEWEWCYLDQRMVTPVHRQTG
ncbi:MAG TPA: UBP-type zinc finger domain-containing protein [Acidimicrobiia bacterium]|nr:UBP-type zinc finger domain-containing protein [Acidimicrobiia bacterium]